LISQTPGALMLCFEANEWSLKIGCGIRAHGTPSSYRLMTRMLDPAGDKAPPVRTKKRPD